MKTSLRLSIMGALAAAGLAQAGAAPTSTTYTTNAVQTLTVKLLAYTQSSATTVVRGTLVNSDLISSVGTFAKNAQLLLLNSTNFVIRQINRGTNMDTTITNITYGALGTNIIANLSSSSAMDYFLETFRFTSPSLQVNLDGLTTANAMNSSFSSTVIGSGSISNAPTLFQGSVMLGAAKMERVAQP